MPLMINHILKLGSFTQYSNAHKYVDKQTNVKFCSDRKTERQKDIKTERQKDRKTERQNKKRDVPTFQDDVLSGSICPCSI